MSLFCFSSDLRYLTNFSVEMSFTIIVMSNFSTGTCISKNHFNECGRTFYLYKTIKNPLKRDIQVEIQRHIDLNQGNSAPH